MNLYSMYIINLKVGAGRSVVSSYLNEVIIDATNNNDTKDPWLWLRILAADDDDDLDSSDPSGEGSGSSVSRALDHIEQTENHRLNKKTVDTNKAAHLRCWHCSSDPATPPWQWRSPWSPSPCSWQWRVAHERKNIEEDLTSYTHPLSHFNRIRNIWKMNIL